MPIHLTILALVLFVKYPCMNVYEIKQADFVESLSVPVQQIACVIAQNKSLSEEELNFVSHIMDVTQVASKYQPNVSDNIKNLIRETGSDYLEAHKTEFSKFGCPSVFRIQKHILTLMLRRQTATGILMLPMM